MPKPNFKRRAALEAASTEMRHAWKQVPATLWTFVKECKEEGFTRGEAVDLCQQMMWCTFGQITNDPTYGEDKDKGFDPGDLA